MQDTFNIVTLILDDDQDVLDIIKSSLEEAGIHNYLLFFSGDEFIKKLSDNMHILVIDHHLNGTSDGLEVMKAAIKKNPNVFVIAMSGSYDIQVAVDYTNAGVNRFVLKNKDNYIHQLIKFIKEGIDRFMHDIEFFRRQDSLLNA